MGGGVQGLGGGQGRAAHLPTWLGLLSPSACRRHDHAAEVTPWTSKDYFPCDAPCAVRLGPHGKGQGRDLNPCVRTQSPFAWCPPKHSQV